MRSRTFVALCAFAVASLAARPSSAQGERPSAFGVLQDWVAAVNAHTPGRSDAAVDRVSAYTCDSRERLDQLIAVFFAGLTDEKFGSPNGTRASAIALARAQRPASAFLKRAIVLHSDAALRANPDRRREICVTPPQPGLRAAPAADLPTTTHFAAPDLPLFPTDRFVLNRDGQVLGDVVEDWNWSFARYMIHLLPPRAADDPFAGAWYHATTATMFARGEYGESRLHLRRAATELPDDPRVLLDRGCLAEIMGLPMHQVLLGQGTSGGLAPRVPPQAETNGEAERLLRRALDVDPSFVEARVRLGRLLELRAQHEEAASELRLALSTGPTGVLGFYASLFAGRAAQALGRIAEALGHYERASALFPDAQSALLARSQAALLASDLPGVSEPLQRLGDRSAELGSDPWWQYRLGAGRDAAHLMDRLWASVPR